MSERAVLESGFFGDLGGTVREEVSGSVFFLGGNCPGGNYPGGNCPHGGIVRGEIVRWELSKEEFTGQRVIRQNQDFNIHTVTI